MLTSTTRKQASPIAAPKITVTVDDSPIVPKKRPAKNAMTLSERFASETVSQPKISRVSMEGSEDQTDTVKKVLTKTKPSVQKLTLSNKGRNTGVCTEQQMLLKYSLNFYAICP